MAAKWIQIRGYESWGHALPPDLQAWKAKAIQRTGSRLAAWKAQLLQNLGDDGILGRRLRFGHTQEEARAAILQMTVAEIKAEAEVASQEGTLIGRLIHLGKSREEACRDALRMSKDGRMREHIGTREHKSASTDRYLGTFTTPGEGALWIAKKNRVNVGLGAGTSNSAHGSAATSVWRRRRRRGRREEAALRQVKGGTSALLQDGACPRHRLGQTPEDRRRVGTARSGCDRAPDSLEHQETAT